MKKLIILLAFGFLFISSVQTIQAAPSLGYCYCDDGGYASTSDIRDDALEAEVGHTYGGTVFGEFPDEWRSQCKALCEPTFTSPDSEKPVLTSVSTNTVFNTNLSRGSTGTEVSTLQTTLSKLGFFKGIVDGIFGLVTKQAVSDFQVKNIILPAGHTDLGIFGPKTRDALNKIVTGKVLGETITIYSKGMYGVERFQKKLIELKYLDFKNLTGYFGDATFTAVKNFQLKKGLKADGVLGPETQSSLLVSCDPVMQSITVLSPNGGEVYEIETPMTVTWTSCNLPATTSLNIYLTSSALNSDFAFIGNTLNDGTETKNIPPEMALWGTKYKIHITTVNNNPVLSDYSDDVFTINDHPFVGPGPSGSTPMCDERDDFWQYDPAQDKWTEQAAFLGGKRESAAGFTIANVAYIATGQYENANNETVYTNDLWAWDGDNNTWTQKASLQSWLARAGAVGFSIGRRGYIGTGGNDSQLFNDFWEYDGDIDSPNYNTWAQKANVGSVGRTAAVGFSIAGESNSKAYIGTGSNGAGTLLKDFYEWDQNANVWTQKADFGGTARNHAVGFSFNDLGYIGTGKAGGGYTNDFWQYNPVTNTWSSKTPLPAEPRFGAVGFANESNGYIGTGSSLSGAKQDFWEYSETTNSWTQRADYGGGPTTYAVGFGFRSYGHIATGFRCEDEEPTACTPNSWNKKADFIGSARWQSEGLSIGANNKGYIGMGSNATVSGYKDFYEWDQATNTWTAKNNLTGPGRVDPAGFTIGTKAYTGTGSNGNTTYYNDFWEWDQTTNVWTQKQNVPGHGRRSAVGFSIGIRGYLGTGVNDNLPYNSAHLNDFYEYNPASNTWTAKANFPGTARASAVGFSLLAKGYVGTGATYNTSFNDFYEYNPASNTWAQKANFPGVARGQASGFSIGSYGYLGVGARNNYATNNSALKDFYRYDPATDTWVQKADFLGTPRFNAAAFSIGNRGYIGTGLDNNNNALNYTKDFYEYCPD
jgi:N-acetylneuraminic acid mutarotase/peptidoglycan hydrolase-like protein with peptidoglycan-binding domain